MVLLHLIFNRKMGKKNIINRLYLYLYLFPWVCLDKLLQNGVLSLKQAFVKKTLRSC